MKRAPESRFRALFIPLTDGPAPPAETIDEVLWMIGNDAMAREELATGLGIDAAERCQSRDAFSRILRVLLHGVHVHCALVKPLGEAARSTFSSAFDDLPKLTRTLLELIEATCHLIVRRVVIDPLNQQRNLEYDFAVSDSLSFLDEASAALKTEFSQALNLQTGHIAEESLVDGLRLIFKDRLTVVPKNGFQQYYFAPALALCHLMVRDNASERKDIIVSLATRLLSSGAQSTGHQTTASPFQVQLCTPVLSDILQIDFDSVLAPRLKFKILSDSDSTTVTIFAIVRVLIDSQRRKTGKDMGDKLRGRVDIFPHYEDGIKLVPAAMHQLVAKEPRSCGLGSDLLISLLIASFTLSTNRRGSLVFRSLKAITVNLVETFRSEGEVAVKSAEQLEVVLLTLAELGETYLDLLAEIRDGGYVDDVNVVEERELSGFVLDRVEYVSQDAELCGSLGAKKAVDYALDNWDIILRSSESNERQIQSRASEAVAHVAAPAAAPATTGLPSSANMEAMDALARARAKAAAKPSSRAVTPGVQMVSGSRQKSQVSALDQKLAGSGLAGIASNISSQPEHQTRPTEITALDRKLAGMGPAGPVAAPSNISSHVDTRPTLGTPPQSIRGMESDALAKARVRETMQSSNETTLKPGALSMEVKEMKDTGRYSDNNAFVSASTSMQYTKVKKSDEDDYSVTEPEDSDDNMCSNTHTVAARGIMGSDPIAMEEGTAEESLPMAVAISQEDIEKEDAVVYGAAEEYDPTSIPNLLKSRRFICGSLCCLGIVVAIAVGVSLGVTNKVVSDDGSPSTKIPVCIKDSDGYFEKLLTLSTEASLCERGAPQFYSYHWMKLADERKLLPSDPHFLQRYVLALLYFSTRGFDWKTCGGRSNTTECRFQCYGRQCETDDRCDGSKCIAKRYLSGESECLWYGSSCDTNGTLVDLQHLSNNLDGTLPREISYLTSLYRLSLPDNSLSGPIPASLGKMTQLGDLNLKFNDMTGTIPVELFNLHELRTVDLGSNLLEGTISPEWAKLRNLKALRLYNNSFSSYLPDELGDLRDLVYLTLQRNQITGVLPTTVGNLSQLKELIIDFNLFNGAIPSQVGDLVDIEILQLNNNKFSSSIPDEVFNLKKLKFLYLYDNELTGTLSSQVGHLVNLTRFIVDGNDLRGEIPQELANLTQLQYLWLHYNDFSGSMPDAICALKENEKVLESLYSDCLLGGSVECDGNCCTDCCHKSLQQCFPTN